MSWLGGTDVWGNRPLHARVWVEDGGKKRHKIKAAREKSRPFSTFIATETLEYMDSSGKFRPSLCRGGQAIRPYA